MKSKAKNLDDLSQLIQDDLDTLLMGFDVSHLENSEGQTLEFLACEIVANNVKEYKSYLKGIHNENSTPPTS
jgi:hypothetical protein